jgi:putative transposase
MKKDLREVWLSPNRAAAEAAIDVFAEKYAAKGFVAKLQMARS